MSSPTEPGLEQAWQSDEGLPYDAVCRLCRCIPAANVTFRGIRGMILLGSFLRDDGPFCRDCGLATFRRMTANTLAFGWWGLIPFFVTPITVLDNLVQRRKVAKLAAPQPMPGFVPHVPGPLNPGKPVMSRVRSWAGIVIVLAVLGGLISLFTNADSTLGKVGGCTNYNKFVSCNSTHDGKIIDIVEDRDQCPSQSDSLLLARGLVYCLVDD